MPFSQWSHSRNHAVVSFSYAPIRTNKIYGDDQSNIRKADHQLGIKMDEHWPWSSMTMYKLSNSLYSKGMKAKGRLQENFADSHNLFRLEPCIFLQVDLFFEVKKVKLRNLIQNFLSFNKNFKWRNFLIHTISVFGSKSMNLSFIFLKKFNLLI